MVRVDDMLSSTPMGQQLSALPSHVGPLCGSVGHQLWVSNHFQEATRAMREGRLVARTP